MILIYLLFGVVISAVSAMDGHHVVYTVSASWCKSPCDMWQKMVSEASRDFPNISFVTIDESVVTRHTTATNLNLPMSLYAFDDNLHVFGYRKTKLHLRRWLQDGLRGVFSLVPDSVEDFSERQNAYDGSITLIGSSKPVYTNQLAAMLPSVGVTWLPLTPLPNMPSPNTSIVTAVDGHVTQASHHNMTFLHRLLPPMIPFEYTKKESNLNIMRALSFSEVRIVSDAPLGMHWYRMADRYPYTAFVHYRSDQTDLFSPSVAVYNRSVDFTFRSVGPDVETWYDNVMSGQAEPTVRPSKEPSARDPNFFDVTGNNAWAWIRASKDAYLYLYDDEHAAAECAEAFENAPPGSSLGRMDLSGNDHESLPEPAIVGQAIRYKDGVARQLAPCKNLSFWNKPTSDVNKDEL